MNFVVIHLNHPRLIQRMYKMLPVYHYEKDRQSNRKKTAQRLEIIRGKINVILCLNSINLLLYSEIFEKIIDNK